MNVVAPFQPFGDFERDALDRARGPFKTQFGAVPYRDRHQKHANRHEWLIKGVMTRGEQAMLVGASQTGKSFLAYDISMAIARGVPWMGRKARRGLVIYHAGESARACATSASRPTIRCTACATRTTTRSFC